MPSIRHHKRHYSSEMVLSTVNYNTSRANVYMSLIQEA